MSDYKGFITRSKFIELRNMLWKMADTRGLENKLHHLYQPDTDMNDKICEDFKTSKQHIVCDLLEMGKEYTEFMITIVKLEES